MCLISHARRYHNLAADKHGKRAFYSLYAMQWEDEDGLKIGPDPELTDVGRAQAARVAAVWKSEAERQMPQLQSIYVSPLRRAGETCEISIGQVSSVQPLVVEHLREGLNTFHEREHGLPIDRSIGMSDAEMDKLFFTDNARSTKSELAQLFPRFAFEQGFTERDELWTPSVRENGQQHIARTRSVLDRIFAYDPSTYVGLFAQCVSSLRSRLMTTVAGLS